MGTLFLTLHCGGGGSTTGGGDGTPSTGSPDTNTWAYDAANRLLSRPGVSYSYDANGNTVSMTDSTGTTTYQYDYENRLIKTTKPDGSVVEYKYDPFGRRIEKNVNGTITRYVYDREDILFELDGNNNIVTEYLHGPGIDEPIAMIKNNQTYYYHADGLGSIIAITDANRNVVQRYEYNSFGEITYQQDPNFKQPYTYTGREYDEESGLYYYRARYYDAKVGRFLQQDPSGFNGGDVNLYSYVGQSPLNWIDPFGLEKIITMEENCSCTYGASVTVTDTDTNKTLFTGRGSTLPNNPGQQNTVGAGTYSGKNTKRKSSGGPGIYIGDSPTAPGSPGSTATEIFIHCGYSETNRGSAGCLTIQPSQCEEFFRIFGKEEPVTVNIGR